MIRRRPNHNDRNTKFGRGGRAPSRDGKRAYDRRSGTGRGREIKKGGGGARNWGSDKNEARQAEGFVDEAGQEPTMEDTTENNADNEDAAVEEEPAPEPEEDKTMSYEEYLASKKGPETAAFKPVQEREVSNEFAGMKLAKKDEEEDFLVMGGGKQKKSKQKKTDTKVSTITPEFRVASSSGDDRTRDGGGRGGRGRGGRGRDGGRGRGGSRDGRGRDGRGRGGRGGGRGERGRGQDQGLNVMDQSAFPSL